MVRDANEDPQFIEKFKESIRQHPKPPFSGWKFFGAIMIAYLWAQIAILAIPEEDFFGISFRYLHWCIPLVVSLGKRI